MEFLWFLLFSFSFTLSKSTPDSAILLSLKKSIFNDPSNLLSTWNPSTIHCSWYGVRCANFSDKVTALSLAQSGFSGEIPADIGDLKFLEVLELQGNNFSGQIPFQISSLPYLSVLNLSFNSFSGYIPDKLIGNTNLIVIDLSNNLLSGRITVDNSSRCEFLIHLRLSNNYLVENIPPEIGNCKNLRTLLLDGNVLQGKIPVEMGHITELRVLDVSRNSLTDVIPKEIANCKKLSAVVLTNLVDLGPDEKTNSMDSFRGEFNAFDGGVPFELFFLSNLEVLWAPRANLVGRLPEIWSEFCSFRVLNLGQNYFGGVVPENIGMCKNLTFLDLSSNALFGYLPWQLHVPCITYLNVSRNNISGNIPGYRKASCDGSMVSYGLYSSFIDMEDTWVAFAYSNLPFWGPKMGSMMNENFAIIHDLSWNSFTGPLPMFSIGDQLSAGNSKFSYRLLLNNNMLNGSSYGELISDCDKLQSVSVNLSANQIGGGMLEAFFLDCLQLTEFEAAYNQIEGSIDPGIGNLMMLQLLDLRGNRLSESLPDQLGNLKNLTWISLGENSLTGEIPSELGQLTSLKLLDLSYNSLTGSIPASLTNATNLETLLLNHNRLSGEIPSSFSLLSRLTVLDLSFNDFSGPIPNLQHQSNCTAFRGNKRLPQCLPSAAAPEKPMGPAKFPKGRNLKPFIIAAVTSASVLLCMVPVIVIICQFGRRKFRRHGALKGKVVVTFADAPNELNYDNVARATGNFSIRNLIGTGGFGSTYKAELVPGYHVAVKRLYIGRFQGIQQFDAEIRTLGRIRHKNLVTLIGYYAGENEMFLIYNYLSGGNLETFIHDKSGNFVQWSVIYKITMDIAQALAYLHYSCVPRIVHRDIKPSNILLDENLNAFLSDFGLARLLEVSETHATTDVAGTFGYVAPEYATTCRVSDKADVYSFGVVLLELLSGKKSLDPSFSEYGNGINIVEWTKLLIKEGRPSELFSAELWETGPRENLLGMLRLAYACTAETLSVRPSMKQVLEKLKQLKS
ncbi:LRR receptor-like serine/threonine-protein kinase RPK2 [Durio zibethinus]|uniref:non-specific serine/threonine protein kinase n=1 Tax=Durio zibethinus TaxID=66656 RepID=A0A6P5YMK9_DURZI|nr:LRR receptor-like serine/threonine-protein kinase RPK2 [Durio zibethinus]